MDTDDKSFTGKIRAFLLKKHRLTLPQFFARI